MSIVSKPYTFSAGAVIVASEHNSNFDTLYSDYNGNITNANISGSASVAYSKLDLTGSIVNADINSSAAIVGSKLDLSSPGGIGGTTPAAGAFSTLKVGTTHQGDILYDNGTSLVRLVPGTSGYFLKTQGNGANPVWASNNQLSNVLFQYQGQVDFQGSYDGEYSGTSLNPAAATGNYRFLQKDGNGYKTTWTSRWIKISGVSTITILSRIWVRTAGGNTANVRVNVGGQSNNVSGTLNSTSPEWVTFTIDVSSLSNGTAYDVTASLKDDASGTNGVYCSNIIGIGS